MALRVLYLTSFSADLYAATGKSLLESYAKIGSPHNMLVCHEGVLGLENKFSVEVYDLAQDEFLQTWLKDNRDVIPQHLGGDLPPCHCPNRHVRHAKHKPGCIQDWMRRNASRWFRKVASWRYASRRDDVDILFWVDCDCVFHRVMPPEKLESYFSGASVFYFRAHRPAPETGLLGFDLRKDGRAFIKALCKRYTSKEYRKYERYDDGFQVGTVIDEKRFKTRDVVPGKFKKNDVIPFSDIVEFVTHSKGDNSAKFNVMI